MMNTQTTRHSSSILAVLVVCYAFQMTGFVSPRVVFLISAVLIFMLTLASAFALRVPPRKEVTPHFSDAAFSR